MEGIGDVCDENDVAREQEFEKQDLFCTIAKIITLAGNLSSETHPLYEMRGHWMLNFHIDFHLNKEVDRTEHPKYIIVRYHGHKNCFQPWSHSLLKCYIVR